MSKMACPCGNVISDSQYPLPTEGWILREQDQLSFQDAVVQDIESFFAAAFGGRREAWLRDYFSFMYPIDARNVEIVNDIIGVHEDRFVLSIAECEQCGRLHVQREPRINSYQSFAPDGQGYTGVLRTRTDTQAEPAVPTDGEGI
jgi:hypothetical protein